MLLVEDDPTLCGVLDMILTSAGCTVSAFTDPIKALHNLRVAPDLVDIMLSDFHMPGLQGDELAKEVFALRPNLPVILMSGSGAISVPTHVSALIEKPVTETALLRIINSAVEAAQQTSTGADAAPVA